jgi:hypothetical protein
LTISAMTGAGMVSNAASAMAENPEITIDLRMD